MEEPQAPIGQPFYIQEPTIGMMNIIGSVSIPISLDQFYQNFVEDDKIVGCQLKEQEKGFVPPRKKNKKNPSKKTMYNQITLFIRHENKCFKIKVYNSGNIHFPGCKKEEDANVLIILVSDKIKSLNICDNTKVVPVVFKHNMMVTMQYKLNLQGMLIDRTKLMFKVCNEYKTLALFNPERYPGVKIPFVPEGQTRKVTIIIQASGIIAMKGGVSMEHNMLAHDFINKIILEHVEEMKKPKGKVKDSVNN